MYRKIEPPLRMTRNEASEHYQDAFIVMQMIVWICLMMLVLCFMWAIVSENCMRW